LTQLAPILFVLFGLVPENEWIWFSLYVNNVHHMTVERATTPRESKRFRVLDAETRKPVPGARVVAVHDFDWMDDWVLSATTDADGVATVRLATKFMHLLHVHVGGDAYLTRDWLIFEGHARVPGVGRLDDDPVDIYLYRRPEATTGLRVPAGFRGAIVYHAGPTKYDFPFPPTFPAGQRVWWTDAKPDGETIIEQAPRLGFAPGEDNPFRVVDSDGKPIPTPLPGADLRSVAAWMIGTREPGGPWGRIEVVLVIGDRDAAIAKAREMWQQYGNGDKGYIPNGWLRVVSPETKLSNPEQPHAVTRVRASR
jgi:hypothetical protein